MHKLCYALIVTWLLPGVSYAGTPQLLPKTYVTSYHAAKKDGKVLAVLLTLPNCPGCLAVAKDPLYGEATLRRLPHFVKLQAERYPELAANLAGGKIESVAAPQLCLFWYRDGRWIIERQVGSNNIKAFVRDRLLTRRQPIRDLIR